MHTRGAGFLAAGIAVVALAAVVATRRGTPSELAARPTDRAPSDQLGAPPRGSPRPAARATSSAPVDLDAPPSPTDASDPALGLTPDGSGASDDDTAASARGFQGRYWNDTIDVRTPEALNPERWDALLRQASRGVDRLTRWKAFEEAAGLAWASWALDADPAGQARGLADLLAVHQAEADPEARARELTYLAVRVAPARADPVLERAAERAREGTTEAERRAAIRCLSRFASPEIAKAWKRHVAADTPAAGIQSAVTQLRARALANLRAIPADSREPAEREAIAAALALGVDLPPPEAR